MLFKFIVYNFLVLFSAFVGANEENSDLKEVAFKYVSDSQRIEVVRKNNSKCATGFENYIELTGAIDQNTVLVIERLLNQLSNCELQFGRKKNITIYLNSRGGRAYDGVKLGRLFREYNIKALVRNSQSCSSACAFAFVGAMFRGIGNESELLFHAPFKKELFGIACEGESSSQWLKDYFIEMLGSRQGGQLFDKTMTNCSTNKGWMLNNKNIKFLKYKDF